MADSIVNFEQLLAPISEERPCGIDIREDESPTSAYYQLKDARNAARADERSQAGKSAEEREQSKHWDTILDLAPRVLTEQTKDLEVAAWYVEALVRKYQLAGLADGFTLLNSLIEQFWDGIYPAEDEDGVATKIAPLSGLFGLSAPGTLAQPINCIAITDSKQEPSYQAWQYVQAANLARAPDAKARNKRIAGGVPTIEKLEVAAKKSGKTFYENLQLNLEAAQEAFSTLFASIETKVGDEAPNGSSVRSALETINNAINMIAKSMLVAETTTQMSDLDNAEALSTDEAVTAITAGTLSANNIKQRAEAFATLQTIADFFRKTEPHSPISYAIERIVKWGDMALPELLKELVEDNYAYESYCKLAGIKIQKPQAAMPNQGMQPHYNDGYNDTGYNDSMNMNPPPLSNPMDHGGYPPPPAGAPMGGDPMFNNTF